jgi:hypothetical protein
VKTKIVCIEFTFTGICPGCQQDLHDEECEDIYRDQKLTIVDIQKDGWPLCPICDSEISPNYECEVKP